MTGFRAVDLRRVLAVTEPLGPPARRDPFPTEALEALGVVVGAEAVGYCESPWADGFGGYELGTRPAPAWLPAALRATARQDPTHPVFCGSARRPIAVSDFLTAGELRRREVYELIWKPLGTADSLRLYLGSPKGTARFFFFDRSRRGFPERSRRLLELLRPTLERARGEWAQPAEAAVAAQLSPREQEILHWVARGLTNDEVARRLWLSPHTVRTHLQHIYEKLGVRTRTEAAARVRLP
jgi:DNA-binding CsgD family transcriptional regulator